VKFGPVPIDQAEGAILAHSLGLTDRRLKKGRTLGAGDIAALREAGIAEVTVARLDPDDVPEDSAARRIADALARDPRSLGLTVAAPFTGRANLFADHDGVLEIDTAEVDALNAIDPAVTLATLPPMTRVSARQMVATVKIIPYAAPGAAVLRAEQLLSGQVLKVHPFRVRSASLILTKTQGMKPALLTKGADAVRERLVSLGIADAAEHIVDHDVGGLAAALKDAEGEIVLILTGSATSDAMDVGPASVLAAGGTVTRFGMPVDPGNLLFLGHLGDRPVIGLPGCARSPKLNGADWVLERIAARVPVSGADIAAMGVGGLLKEIPSRPEPRAGGAVAPQRPKIAVAVLAAGGARRMAGRDKLMEPVGGQPLVARIAAEALASQADRVVCVLRDSHPARRAALAGLDVAAVDNPDADRGMGTSIARAVTALDDDVDAVLLMLADMPEITHRDLDRLIAAFDPGEGRAIVRAASLDGRPGHPVLFGRRFFEALSGLDGDEGARRVVREHPEFVVDVPLDGEKALVDLDTPEAWAAWRGKAASLG